jgi:drug/metabolite transporter (DMT)-like permease
MSAAFTTPLPTLQTHWRIYLMVLGITAMWASNLVAVKLAITELPPLFVMGLRTILAGVLILPLFLLTPRRPGERSLMRSQFWILAIVGVVGVTFNQLLFTLAMERTSVAHGSLIISTTPIFILLLASLIGQERLTPLKVLGMLVALSGVAIIQLTPAKSEGSSLIGDLLALAGAITFAAFTVFGKAYTREHSGITVNTFAYIGGGALLLPVVLFLWAGIDPASVSLSGWLCVLYMAIFPSVLCYVGYFYVLNHIPASQVAVFAYLQPAIATCLAVPLLGESVSSSLIGGGLLALLGVFVTQKG